MTPEERAEAIVEDYGDAHLRGIREAIATDIATAIRDAVAAERERCAEVAEETEVAGAWCGGEDGSYWESDASRTREAIARRIREG